MPKAPALLVMLFSLSCLASCSGAAAVEAQPGMLLDVANGQKPNDTGTPATKIEIVDLAALSGKALQVDFAAGDSFGVKGPKTTDWSRSGTLQFDAFNPMRQPALLSLNVFHGQTTNYKTRVVAPIRLEPGKNSIRLNVADLRNVNGSVPDLTAIKKWFIAAAEGTSPKLFFGPISLTGASAAPSKSVAPTAPETQQPTAPAASAFLLDVAHGHKPNDTGSPQTKTEIVDQPELGGKALKVEFAPGDSFGMKSPKTNNWMGYSTLRFDAFNPTQQPASLTLNIFHNRTANYKTRLVVPIRVEPGKQSFRLPVSDFKNVDGSTPDLSQIKNWFIAAEEGAAPTLFFGPMVLSGSAAVPRPSPEPALPSAALGRTQKFRVTGKIGGQDVDLIVTPFDDNSAPASGSVTSKTDIQRPSAAAPPPARAVSDPARLERIRAAKPPQMWKPVALDTPEADAILSGLEVFPSENPWNTLVSDWPLHLDSKQIVAAIGADKPLRYNPDMAYVLVPPHQPRIPVKLVDYAEESDPGPYPVPDNLPIEGWPAEYRRRSDAARYTLDSVQRDRDNAGGDRHAIVVDPVNRMLYEFYQMRKTEAGWQAACAAVFDLKSNQLRPDGWTSTDAAGLPLFPALVRYDELKRGIIDHALRVTVRRSRKAYVYPATHQAGHGTETSLPRMGERLRLRRDFDMSGFSPDVKTILTALQRYGMIVADNGIEWAVSVAPDPRIPSLHDELRKVSGHDFEVVEPPAGYQPPE